MSEIPEGGEKKGWWKRQTLTAKILIGFLIIFILGVVAVSAFVMSLPTYTALNVSATVNDSMTADKSTIEGITEPGATVTVNNHSVTPDSSGKFSYQITNIAAGTHNVTVIVKAPNKEPTTAIIEMIRENSKRGYGLQTQVINQTDVEIVKV